MTTVDFYNQLTPFYHLLFPGGWQASIERQASVLDAIIKEFWGDGVETILDVACGIGTQTLGLAQLGYSITASDLSDGALERAEKEGLVHQTTNIQDSALFLCNCCSCCCPALMSFKQVGETGASARSNFEPRIDRDECVLCDECVQICPMEAIYHHYPHREDGSDEYILINNKLCLGCGVCASNCPSEAI